MRGLSHGRGLAVVEAHPVQYHAPIYRALQGDFGIPTTVIYGSRRGAVPYVDPEFEREVDWNVDLLQGYDWRVLEPSSLNNWLTYYHIRCAIQAASPAAVLLVGYGSHFDRHAILAALLSRHRVMLRAETTDHAKKRHPFLTPIRDGLLRRFYRRCTSILYIGCRSLAHHKRLGCPPSKLHFSPYCVDDSPFATGETARLKLRDAARNTWDIAKDGLVLLFVGKLVSRKAPHDLLAAVRELPLRLGQRAVIVVVGDGPLLGDLRHVAAQSPRVRVLFVGFQDQRHISAFYHAADMLVLPSIADETWGLVVNEALQHGVPCIVSDAVGSAPDLIEPRATGEIYRAGSPKELAHAIANAAAWIGNPGVRTMCREKVAPFCVRTAAEGIAAAYDKMLRAPRSA